MDLPIIKNETIIFAIAKILPFNGLDKSWISLNVLNNISKAVIKFSYSPESKAWKTNFEAINKCFVQIEFGMNLNAGEWDVVQTIIQ